MFVGNSKFPPQHNRPLLSGILYEALPTQNLGVDILALYVLLKDCTTQMGSRPLVMSHTERSALLCSIPCNKLKLSSAK